MKYRELAQRLNRLGCEFVRQAPGSHEIWRNQANGNFTVIPRHGGRDLPTGTLRAILRQLDISPEEFYGERKK
jgi:predicted RNA binding protein YcfA (HicA-like mRNA interferase family)